MRTRQASLAIGALVGALALPLGACSDGGTANAAEFCEQVDANKREITKPKLRTDQDVDAYVELHRELGEMAPLAIEDQWSDLTSLYETAVSVDPTDADSVEQARAKSYATERSAVEVRDWLRANCRVNLGPVTTIVPHNNATAGNTLGSLPG